MDDDRLKLKIKADRGISEGEWNEMWVEGEKEVGGMS
jgi:hypothetical protein